VLGRSVQDYRLSRRVRLTTVSAAFYSTSLTTVADWSNNLTCNLTWAMFRILFLGVIDVATSSASPAIAPRPTLSRLAQRPWRAFLLMYGIQGISFTTLAYFFYHVLRLPNESGNLRATSTVALFTVSGVWGYLFVPFLLRLPYGKRSFRGYLDDIRLTRVRPFLPLVVLTVSCVLILVVCQGAGSLVYRVVEGKSLSAEFIRQVFNLTAVLPPQSTLLYGQMFSCLEEVAFRGVLLTMLLRRYSPRMAIVYSALVFGVLHLATLAMGRPMIQVLAQVIWAFAYGLFYGYIFLKSGSLLPPMIIHWLSNVFQAQLTQYWNAASIGMQAVFGVVFGYGLAAVLSIIWVRFFAPRWLPPTEPERTP